jgi:PAS domain S-box-containing protein/putative nucleotidyltransferase with HDIG domain
VELRVLFVEDSADDVELMLCRLREAGIEPHWERVQSEAALRKALAGERWELALVDCSLPDGGGLQALRVLAEVAPGVPAIAVSGVVSEETAVAAISAGAVDYVLMGNLTRLAPAVRRAVEGAERRRQERRLAGQDRRAQYAIEHSSQAIVSARDITEQREVEERAKESEERFRTIFEEAPLGVALIDSLTGRIYEVNPRFAQIAGRTRAEMATIDWMSITHPDDVQEDLDNMALLNAGKIPGFNMDKRYLRPDGSYVWIGMTIAPVIVKDKSHPRHLCMIEDITERKKAELLLSAQSEILEILTTPAPVPETVEGIVAALKRATGFDAVGLRLREDEDYPFVAAIGYSDEFLRAENTVAVRYPDGGACRDEDGAVSLECTCGLVLAGRTDSANPLFTSGGSACTNDALPLLGLPPEEDPRLHPRNRCIHVGFQSIALVPLRAGNEIVGLLHLADRRKDRFTAESIRFFEGVGASIGVALLHRQAEAEVRRQAEQLRRTVEGTVLAMSHVVETRDPYTAGHERRVAELATAIAAEMGVGGEGLDAVRHAGLIHDIGKIAVPAEILSKPGRLSEVEFTLISEHPATGFDILAAIDFGRPVAEMVLQHHERLDGSGYPRALSGVDILPEARILAVADVVEAMSSHRPYRAALGMEAALAEIRGHAGVKYDADVAAVCFRVVEEQGFRFTP